MNQSTFVFALNVSVLKVTAPSCFTHTGMSFQCKMFSATQRFQPCVFWISEVHIYIKKPLLTFHRVIFKDGLLNYKKDRLVICELTFILFQICKKSFLPRIDIVGTVGWKWQFWKLRNLQAMRNWGLSLWAFILILLLGICFPCHNWVDLIGCAVLNFQHHIAWRNDFGVLGYNVIYASAICCCYSAGV